MQFEVRARSVYSYLESLRTFDTYTSIEDATSTFDQSSTSVVFYTVDQGTEMSRPMLYNASSSLRMLPVAAYYLHIIFQTYALCLRI